MSLNHSCGVCVLFLDWLGGFEMMKLSDEVGIVQQRIMYLVGAFQLKI